MTFSLRRAGLLFVLSLGLLAISSSPASAQPPSEASIAWGFDRSDLPPHPGVRFGVLRNGMRYAIMRNGSPAGSLSVRLRIDVGAGVESKREQGFVHLIEHLIFHGTSNVPEGSLPLMLAHRGLRRWTDFDAYTSYDETVFRLNLGRSDAAAREVSLLLMREIATNLPFTRGSVEGGKRKVQEEISGRDAMLDGMMSAQNAFYAPGTPIARGPVAGTRAEVARATPAALRRLYEHYYLPQRTTLVLVGDFNPDAVEAEISSRFSDWRAAAAAERVRPVIAPQRGTEVRLFIDRAAPTSVTIARAVPLEASVDAGGRRDSHFLELLGTQMLNRRLTAVAARSDAPFVKAQLAIYDHHATVRLAELEIQARDGGWEKAMTGGAVELRRALTTGFSQSELDEQLAVTRKSLLQSAAPISAPALADAIIDAVGRRIVFTAPGDGAGTDAYLARVRLADVDAAFRAAWSGPQRLVFVTHDRRIQGDEGAVLAAWEAAGL